MRAFTEPLQELEEFQKIQQALKKQSSSGRMYDARSTFIYAAGRRQKETDRHIQ